MRSVKMNRVELLEIVKNNLIKHALDYEEAVNGYKVAALKISTENLKLAKSGDLEKIGKIRSLPPKPVSYADEYTRAIRMLELSVEDIIEIQDGVFDQLVLDEWHWKTSFVASTALYKSMI